jgi:hypothetical protein
LERARATKQEERNPQATTPKQFVQDEVSTDVSAVECLVREAGM